jgi:predicted outer membrane repeat protein
MNDGTISDNSADRGGGVSVFGRFTMNDGTISDNSASSGGGGVYVDGEFTMNDGTISDNSASYGGGVSVFGGGFTMKDGTISGNSADRGGGVYVSGEGFNAGTITKESGGTIYGSNANSTLKNTATEGDSYGHAVLYVGDSPKKRNSTAGIGVILNTGTKGGWE